MMKNKIAYIPSQKEFLQGIKEFERREPIGLTYYVYFPSENFLYLLVGFLALIGSFMNSYTADKYDGLMKKKLGPGKHYFRISRDVRMFIIFMGALINQPVLVLFIIAFAMNAEDIRRIVMFYKSR